MDMNSQKAETEAVFRDMAAQGPLPEKADIDFQFAPEGENADWDALTDAVEALGHEVQWYQGEDVEDRWLEVTVADCRVAFDAIWAHEERLTLLAAVHGFGPQGWGVFVDTPE